MVDAVCNRMSRSLIVTDPRTDLTAACIAAAVLPGDGEVSASARNRRRGDVFQTIRKVRDTFVASESGAD